VNKLERRGALAALILLTSLNLLNYIDRYIFSALLPAIKSDLHFSDTQLGILGSGFIIAYLFISPVFGVLGDRFKRTKVMGVGVAVWSIATAFSGLTRSFFGQLTTRIVVGLGESSYTVVSPGFLADVFSKRSRGKVFAIYSGAISVGSALGYLLGGVLESRFGWQRAFFVVGIPGIFLSFLLFLFPEPVRGSLDSTPENEPQKKYQNLDQKRYFLKATRELFSNQAYLSIVLGYAAYTFVVGGLAFWMPSYIVRYFDVSLARANLTFGGLTVAGGFVGTLAGGFISDAWEKKYGNAYLKLAVAAMALAIPLFWLSLQAKNFDQFCLILFFLELALFICLSPLDTAVICYVRPEVRAMAMAWDVFLIHLLGDGISRTLIGSVSDTSGLSAALSICPWVLLIAALIWLFGILRYWQPAMLSKAEFSVPLLQAHRGFTDSGKLQENSIEAFASSREKKFQMAELDVRLSRAGDVVVSHDELSHLTGDKLSLAAVLQSESLPRYLNIEIKSDDFKYHHLVREVARTIEQFGFENRVLISSFNPLVLRMMAELNPKISRAYLVEHRGWNIFLPGHIISSFLAHPHMLNIKESLLDQKTCAHFKRRGIPIVAWTVNDLTRARELLGYGVQSIITDQILPAELHN